MSLSLIAFLLPACRLEGIDGVVLAEQIALVESRSLLPLGTPSITPNILLQSFYFFLFFSTVVSSQFPNMAPRLQVHLPEKLAGPLAHLQLSSPLIRRHGIQGVYANLQVRLAYMLALQ